MNPAMAANRIALKEWAIVTEALRRGTQRILLRKGGISEGPNGFQVEHNEFWMFPTQFHQTSDQVRIEVADQLPSVPVPPAGRVPLDVYAVVTGVEFCQDEAEVLRRVPEQILSEETVRDRFRYRTPGLFVVSLEVFVAEAIHWIDDRPAYAGCRSWVPLEEEISTDGLKRVEAAQPQDS